MGIWDIIRWPFGQLLRLSYELLGSYAIAILLFALAIKIVMLPLGIKQQKSQIKAAKLRPKMAAIEKKYAGRTDRKTLEKKQREMMDLQQSEGYSPLSGCLPLLIQLPIILILYSIIQNPLTYLASIDEATIEALRTALDMANATQYQLLDAVKASTGAIAGVSADALAAIRGLDLTLFNSINLSVTPSIKSLGSPSVDTWLLIIPVLTFASSFLSMKLSRKMTANPAMAAASEDMQKSNMIMDIMMPAMSLFIAFGVPAAIGLYWVFQSVLGVAQQFALAKAMPLPKYTDEEIRAIQKAEKERQAAAVAAAKQRQARYALDDDEDDDVNVPVIRSHFDNDDEGGEAPAQKPQNSQKKKKKK